MKEDIMQLEDYFDFQRSDDIRIKGTRIGIETVLYDYLHKGRPPEQIAETYVSPSLAQVYATILYYLENREAIDTYMREWLEDWERRVREQDENPPPAVQRFRQLKAERARLIAGR